jgi:hypothetical protein
MKTKKRKLLLTGAVLLFMLCVLASCTEPAPETRPTLYYQDQKYDLLHSESNQIDVSGLLLKKDGPIGIVRYPGEVLFEDLDASDARRVGDEVYVHPEKEDALIYHCEDCNEYFCITRNNRYQTHKRGRIRKTQKSLFTGRKRYSGKRKSCDVKSDSRALRNRRGIGSGATR